MEFTLSEKFLLMRPIISEIEDIKRFLKIEDLGESLKKDHETELAAYESLLKKIKEEL